MENEQIRTTNGKRAMLQALIKSIGVVTPALEEAGIVRSTFYEWLKNDPDYKAEVDGIQNIAIDFVESQLFKNIKAGSDAATIFYLKTIGKKRGYVERSELTGKDGESLFKGATDEELKEILNRISKRVHD